MGFIDQLFDGSLMPHGYCLLWRTDLLVMHVGGDAMTAAAYFAIPGALVRLVRQRRDLAFDRVFLMFAAFIFLCGVTHLFSLLNVWQGFYFLEGAARLSTGVVSALTAIVVWRLLPSALSFPSRDALLRKNRELERAREEILSANARLEEKVRARTAELEALAIIDPLTGTFRRGHALEVLEKELAGALRYQKPLALAMIDLDDFKRINDEHGHLAGDLVLQETGQLLARTSRSSDTVGRFGGEEFIVVMPESDPSHASRAAERIAEELRGHRFTLDSGVSLAVTCSIGIAQATESGDANDMIARADRALYRAKRAGKARTVVDSDASED